MIRLYCLFSLLMFACASHAYAHSLWFLEQGGAVCAVFSETPSPGPLRLQNKALASKIFNFGAGDVIAEVKASVIEGESDRAVLRLDHDCKTNEIQTAHWDYGTFNRGEGDEYLKFFAKRQCFMERQSGKSTVGQELELTALTGDGDRKILATFNGKPIEELEVQLYSDEGEAQTVKTNSDGVAVFSNPGTTAFFRCMHREPASGELEGKPYACVLRVATLMATFAGDASQASETPQSAEALLAEARAHRSTWDGFQGARCRLTVAFGGRMHEGKMSISADGDVTLEIGDAETLKWCQPTLDSLISHRIPGSSLSDKAKFVVEEGMHPLGKKIQLEEDSMGSEYRIGNNQVNEVNRTTPGGRFRISVLSSEYDVQGRYLPTVWAVNTWDKDGTLVSSSVSRQAWQTVGAWRMPKSLLVLDAKNQGDETRSIEFSDWFLSTN